MRRILDKLGISLSCACALHCILSSIVLAASPALGTIWTDEIVHIGFALIAIPVSIWALVVRSEKELSSKAAYVGSTLLILGIIFHEHTVLLTVSGALVLAFGHIVNIFGSSWKLSSTGWLN